MITVDLRDPYLIENYKALKELKELGFSDAEIQKYYDKQVETDKAESEEVSGTT